MQSWSPILYLEMRQEQNKSILSQTPLFSSIFILSVIITGQHSGPGNREPVCVPLPHVRLQSHDRRHSVGNRLGISRGTETQGEHVERRVTLRTVNMTFTMAFSIELMY
jgi:hypothetical protein